MTKKRLFLSITVILLIGAALYLFRLNAMAKVGVGYMVKVSCSEVFLAGRSLKEVKQDDFNGIDSLMTFAKLELDNDAKELNGHLFGLGHQRAIYRDGVGCSLDIGDGLAPVQIEGIVVRPHKYPKEQQQEIQSVLLKLFDDQASVHPIGTRSAVVIQNGKIVAEHYAPGFNKNTRQQSWSMAKGFTQALVGTAIKEGYLSLEDQALFPHWQKPDPRHKITLGQLLHMSSGLEFEEDYSDPFSHVDQMLFRKSDMGAYAAELNLKHEPGSTSIYSSGTTNIISSLLRDRLEANGVNYHHYAYQALFKKIGMDSTVFEVDASGHFIGSSYIYANLRDFARFGHLYLNNGLWEGQQVLPEGWVEYTRRPAPHSNGTYGSHWSINASDEIYPGMPGDVIGLGGNDGQHILVIPSKNAVIVRLGIMRPPATLENDLYPLLKEIYEIL